MNCNPDSIADGLGGSEELKLGTVKDTLLLDEEDKGRAVEADGTARAP